MKVYSAPRTRAVRVVWLLEELGLPYQLETVEFKPTVDEFFIQDTPTGKIPTLVDGDVTICESGAILEYILERYGDGRLAPQPGSPERGEFLQWMHFAESTAWGPIGVVVWLSVYRQGQGDPEALTADARVRAATTLEHIEKDLEGRDHLLPSGFSAADIMLGFTLSAAQSLQLVSELYPNITGYLGRLTSRDAFRVAAEKVGGF